MRIADFKTIFKRWPVRQGLQIITGILLQQINVGIFRRLQSENRDYDELEAIGFSVRHQGAYTAITKKGADFREILLRRQTSDIKVFFQIFVWNEYDGLFSLITDKSQIRTVIDLGSNIGLASVKFASVFPNASMIVIEPDKSNLEMSKKNLAINRVDYSAIQTGIWDRKTRLYFDRTFSDGGEWAIAVTETPNDGKSIESLSINDLIQSNSLRQIDLLKIDVEGSEKQIFFGDYANLDFLRLTRYIAVEVHEEVVKREQIEHILSEWGFRITSSGEYLIGKNMANFK